MIRFGAKCAALVVVAMGCLAGSSGAAARHRPTNPYALVNGCFAVRPASPQLYVVRSGSGYAASSRRLRGAYRIRMQATALGRYLLMGPDRALLGVDSNGAVSP